MQFCKQGQRSLVCGCSPITRRVRGRKGNCRVVCGWSLPPVYQYCEPWGVWAGLFTAASVGLWSERTRIGREISGSMVCTLVGLVASNVGLMPSTAPQLEIVQKQILTLVIPMLLFQANVRQVFKETGQLLFPFLLGSVCTVIATFAAVAVFPLPQLGCEGWKVASALCSRHIGGAVNYVSVSQALELGQSAQTAGLAADNLVCPFYFISLYALAKTIPPEKDSSLMAVKTEKQIKMVEGCSALCVSMLICAVGCIIVNHYNIKQWMLPTITLLSVFVASVAPNQMQALAPAAEWIAGIGIQVFFAAIGASGKISEVISTAPSLVVFCVLQVFLHLGLMLLVGEKLLGINRKDLLLASNANVGGPTTAAALASVKGWKSRLVPALLIGILGYAIATFVSIALGTFFFKTMMS